MRQEQSDFGIPAFVVINIFQFEEAVLINIIKVYITTHLILWNNCLKYPVIQSEALLSHNSFPSVFPIKCYIILTRLILPNILQVSLKYHHQGIL